MADKTGSVLRRKLGAVRDKAPPATAAVGAQVELGVARAAQAAANLDARLSACAPISLSAAEVVEILPEPALLALLDGDGGRVGLCALSADLVDAVVEMRTMGRVAPPEGSARKPTRIDAALCSGLVDAVLMEFAGEDTRFTGYRYVSRLADSRSLALLLDDEAYVGYRMSLDLGRGTKTGEMILALPKRDQPQDAALRLAPDLDEQGWSRALARAAGEAQVTLAAVLYRLDLTLQEVTRLKPGDMLRLPRSAIDRVRLNGHHPTAEPLWGRLGQMRGFLAVRLGSGAERPRDLQANKDFLPFENRATAAGQERAPDRSDEPPEGAPEQQAPEQAPEQAGEQAPVH